LLTGVVGFTPLIPALSDIAGAVFGLGAMAWFIALGVSLMQRPIGVKI
jgi:hypothetical protein